jgi:hypothetical protein
VSSAYLRQRSLAAPFGFDDNGFFRFQFYNFHHDHNTADHHDNDTADHDHDTADHDHDWGELQHYDYRSPNDYNIEYDHNFHHDHDAADHHDHNTADHHDHDTFDHGSFNADFDLGRASFDVGESRGI